MSEVIQFPHLPAPSQSPLTVPADQSPWKARDIREGASAILKATTAYVCNKATAEPGYIADHTCNGIFAGYGGIVGRKHLDAADRSMRKLVKLMNSAENLMTVELWSLASVASFIINQGNEPGAEIVGEEMVFLKSFAQLIERICKDQYDREVARGRS